MNIWDPRSARTVVAAGAPALSTGSASLAGALGFGDGETVSPDVVLAHAAQIVACVDLPVSVDFEGGNSATADGVAGNVVQVVAPGRPASNLRMAIRRATAKACARLKTRWAGSRLRARRQMRCCQVSGSMRARTSACGEAGDARHTDRGCDCAWQGLCRGRGKQFLRAGAARPLIDLE